MRFPILLTIYIALFIGKGEAKKELPNPSGRTYTLERKALDGRDLQFAPHVGNDPFTNWLGMNLNFSLFEPLFDTLNASLKTPLQNRNEAHITVITPPEFDNVLSKVGITMEDINWIALENNIQEAKINALCLGRVATKLENLEQEAYQVIIKSKQLLQIRQEIFNLYVCSGGEPSQFDPNNYYSHITLGYLHRDLFEQDGIYKGLNACWANLKLL
ncbi:hypothetical protein K7432_005411 [Basidiobolus ranarum]|uniref:Swiss Army Knife 2H phosphoesterase domain-containing protein n=1 Tax=Basidiobolus ranarum TaxID=34480 RepID=A0ABR2W384_9FUNG